MALVVPSDMTILENKTSVGRRRVRILESTGLLLTFPMLHMHYSKIDRADMKAVLQKKYDPEDTSQAAEVCRKRQEAISKQVVGKNFTWGVAGGSAAMVTWSFRRYNYQSRLITLPFVFYGMTYVGRWVGDIVTGRNGEYGRDRWLASLPGKVYFNEAD